MTLHVRVNATKCKVKYEEDLNIFFVNKESPADSRGAPISGSNHRVVVLYPVRPAEVRAVLVV
jgi:hypothetical protein